MPAVKLFIDTVTRSLVQGYKNPAPYSFPSFFQNDTVPFQLHFLEPTGDIGLPYRYIDIGASTVKLGIGNVDTIPTAGTFTITFGANTTTALAYNASASVVSTALNLLASIVSAGGVTVTSAAPGQYTVTFTTPAVTALMTASATGLSPASSVLVNEWAIGSASVSEVQNIKLVQNPAGYQDAWSNLAAATVSVSVQQVGGVGANAIQNVTINNSPIDGSFTLNLDGHVTTGINFFAPAIDVQNALAALSNIGVGNVAVSGRSGGPYTITFTGTLSAMAVNTLVANYTGLISAVGKYADVNLATSGIQILIGSSPSQSTKIELEVTPGGGSPTTYFQNDITIINDLIDGPATTPSPLASFYTASQVLDLLKGTASATSEAGKTAMINGSDTLAIVFSVTKTNANHHEIGGIVRNIIDGSPSVIGKPIIIARSITGYTLKFPSTPDSVNYYYEWHVVLD